MVGPTVNDPASMTDAFYDAEVPNFSSVDWTPSGTHGMTRALYCTTSGTAIVDFVGVGGGGGAASISIPMVANQKLNLCLTKIHHTGSSGAYVALY